MSAVPGRVLTDAELPPRGWTEVLRPFAFGMQGSALVDRTWRSWPFSWIVPLFTAMFFLYQVCVGLGPVARTVVGWAHAHYTVLYRIFTLFCGVYTLCHVCWGHVQPLWKSFM